MATFVKPKNALKRAPKEDKAPPPSFKPAKSRGGGKKYYSLGNSEPKKDNAHPPSSKPAKSRGGGKQKKK
ncbi:hypothetical protein KI387_005438, partial [Taxus chinensis]